MQWNRRFFPWFAVMAMLTLEGCADSPPVAAKADRPAIEVVLAVTPESVQNAVRAAIHTDGWTIDCDTASRTNGVIEAESPSGHRVQIELQARGAGGTWLSVRGRSETPQATVRRLHERIRFFSHAIASRGTDAPAA